METSTYIAGLISNYIARQINEQEMEKLNRWIDCSEANRRLFDEITASEYVEPNLHTYLSIDSARAWEKRQNLSAPQQARLTALQIIAIAAVSIGVIFSVFQIWSSNNENESIAGHPGGYKAMLILNEGTRLNLENWQAGEVARAGQYVIRKVNDSTIQYEFAGQEWDRSPQPQHLPATESYDTIATPKGGQHHIILPDGTDVLLNALSTLCIPRSFSPGRRKVGLSGEAFFKVNDSPANHPAAFIVKLAGATVEVMGTQFNVMAYEDEEVTTTVLEGKVKIQAGEVIEMLTGNQQARVLKNDQIIKENADAREASSWTKGLFQFQDKPLRLILNQACRWYDMEYEMNQELTEVFTVWIEKDKPLSEFLHRLSGTKLVRFEVKGRKIIVHKTDSQ